MTNPFGDPPRASDAGEYDETNKGVVFQQGQNETFVGSGKLNIDGKEVSVAVIRRPINKDGRIENVLYAKIGVLFTNTPKDGETLHERAPKYAGPLDAFPTKRCSAWVGEKNGRHYMQLKVEEKQGGSKPASPFGGSSQPPAEAGYSPDPMNSERYSPDPMANMREEDIPF